LNQGFDPPIWSKREQTLTRDWLVDQITEALLGSIASGRQSRCFWNKTSDGSFFSSGVNAVQFIGKTGSKSVYWSSFMHLTYHVHVHDGGWAYRLGDVWSETYPTHDAALRAARDAAKRQQIGGEDAQISYETADGTWHQESVRGSDRPEVDVEDDAKT
jgi:hypothetical protein